MHAKLYAEQNPNQNIGGNDGGDVGGSADGGDIATQSCTGQQTKVQSGGVDDHFHGNAGDDGDHGGNIGDVINEGDEVSRALMDAFECGTTKLPAKGGFTDVDKTVIYFVVNRFQIARMKNIVHTIDPAAFLTIAEVADVFKSVTAAPSKEAEQEAAAE